MLPHHDEDNDGVRLYALPPLPEPKGIGDRMADYVLDHTNDVVVRFVFLLKIVLSATYGVLSLYTSDVKPPWLIGAMFLVGTVLNIHPLVTLRRTKLISIALSFTVGACAIRAGAIVWAYRHGTLKSGDFPHTFLAASVWVGLALFAIAATIGAATQLGRGSGARGSRPHSR